MNQNRRITAVTLGCKVNAYDTQSMVEIFLTNGFTYTDSDTEADVFLINTCTVTSLADKKSRQAIRHARRVNKDAVIIAAGCMPQVNADTAAECGADIIIGTYERGRVYEIYEKYIASEHIGIAPLPDTANFEELGISRNECHTRAYVKIQDGCERFCAYCIVPYARGRSRSRGFTDCIAECERLAANGYKEIVISGIHIASYGADLQDNLDLSDIITAVQRINGIERIRLGSIDPNYITDGFLQKISVCGKLCGHFHLSLQSGCDRTLRAMNRAYDTAFYAKAAEKIRQLYQNAGLTTDIIAGFPGETEDDFTASMDFCEQMDFAKIHVFPFSAKKGTKAYGMPDQIHAAEKKERTRRFLSLADKLRSFFLDNNAGHTAKVLFEKNDGGIYEGLTENYITVRTKAFSGEINMIYDILLKRDEML